MKSSTATRLRKVRIAMFAISLFLLLDTTFLALSTGSFLRRATRVRASITALEPRTDTADQTVHYYPSFTFTTPDGISRTITSETGTNPPGFRVGQEVNVLVDPANLADARIDNVIQLWLVPMVVGFLGVVFLGVAALLLLIEHKEANAATLPPLAVHMSSVPPPNDP